MKTITIPAETPRTLRTQDLRRIGAFHRLGFPFVIAFVLLLGTAASLIGWIGADASWEHPAPFFVALAFALLSGLTVVLTVRARRNRLKIITNGKLSTGTVDRHVFKIVPWKSKSEPAAIVRITEGRERPIATVVYARGGEIKDDLPEGSEVPCLVDQVGGKAFPLYGGRHELVIGDSASADPEPE